MTPPPNGSGHAWRSQLIAAGVMVLVALCGFLAGMAVDRRIVLSRFPPPPRDGFPAPPGMEGFGGPGGPGGPGAPPPGDSNRRPPRPPGADRMARELSLTPEQSARIDSLLEGQLRQMQAITDPLRPRMDSILERTRHSIDSLLTPEQRARMDSLRMRRGAGPPGWPRP